MVCVCVGVCGRVCHSLVKSVALVASPLLLCLLRFVLLPPVTVLRLCRRCRISSIHCIRRALSFSFLVFSICVVLVCLLYRRVVPPLCAQRIRANAVFPQCFYYKVLLITSML